MLRQFLTCLGRGGRAVVVSSMISALVGAPLLPSLPPAWAVLDDVSATQVPATMATTRHLVIGDVDGDDAPDVVVVTMGQSRLFRNDGAGHFTDITATHLPVLLLPSLAGALGDVDSDGDRDLLLVQAGGHPQLLLNDGTGHFASAPAATLPAVSAVSTAMQFGDVDGDGDLDVIIANRDQPSWLWLNTGQGQFVDVTATHGAALPAGSVGLSVGDVDGNGTLDLLLHGASTRLLRNNGLGVFTDLTATHLPGATGPHLDGVLADVDTDGDLDLIVAAGADGARLWRNDGTGRFTDVTEPAIPDLTVFAIAVAPGDVDGDGLLDIVVAAAGQPQLLRNDGTGQFVAATTSFLPSDARRSFALALVDVDQDLDLDLLLGSPDEPVRLWRNAVTVPRLLLAVAPDYIEVETPVTLTIHAFDEDGLATAALTLTDPAGAVQTIPLLPDLADGQATHGFTPTLAGHYRASVTATDTQQQTSTRQRAFLVQTPDTLAPQVTLTVDAPTPLLVGHTVTIHVAATDARDIHRTTLTINGTSVPLTSAGTATYVPTAVGVATLVAQATDAAGNVGTAETTLTVQADTSPPVLTVQATPALVDLAQPVTLTVTATDNVAVLAPTLRIHSPAQPAGQLVPLTAGQAVYTPYQPGTYTAVATAQDPSGNTGTASTTFEAQGIPDTLSPVVTLSGLAATVAMGFPLTMTVTATDNVGVTSVSLTVNDTPVPLTAQGQATYTPPIVGSYTVVATAADATGNVGTATRTFQALDPTQDTAHPVVAITAPIDDTTITAPTTIRGTVQDATLLRWTLAVSPHDEERFTTIATGTSEVVDSVLGTFDPTLLLNDLYDLRLTGEDATGRLASITVVVRVGGQMKVGHLSFTVTDLSLPMTGIPITINRTYDSRDTSVGDFGVGWRLDLQTMRLRVGRPLGTGWSQASTGTTFPASYCLDRDPARAVTLTLPDGRQEVFDFTPTTPEGAHNSNLFGELPPYCQWLVPIEFATAAYTPRPGTLGTLEALADPTLWLVGGTGESLLILSLDTLDVYAPRRWRYTTPEGMKIVLEQGVGVQQMIDLHGNTLTIGYHGLLHSAGTSVHFTRDTQGRITQITDPVGYTLTYTYDTAGDLVAVTDQEGQTTSYTYNGTHNLMTIADPSGTTVAQTLYDGAGRVMAHLDAHGNRIDYTHDIIGRREVMRDRLGHVTVYTYDDQGNVLGLTNPLGYTTTFTYDTQGRQLTRTNPLGETSTRTYDVHGNVLTVMNPLGHTIFRTYDTRQRLLTHTDPSDHTVAFTYDRLGNLLTITDPLGHVTTYTYDTSQRYIDTITDATGQVTRYMHDTIGRRVQSVDALGHVTTYTYDANNNLLTETVTRTDSSGNTVSITTQRIYDKANRVIAEIDPHGQRTAWEYNVLGQMAAVTDKRGNRTQYMYDAQGNRIQTIYPDNTHETTTYDAAGNRIRWIDRAGRTTFYVYDAMNRLTQTTYPDGAMTRIEYDAAGRVIGNIDEYGNRTTYLYDAAGRRTAIINALGQRTTFTYDAQGNLISVTDARGLTTIHVYDAHNRRVRKDFPDGTSSGMQYDAVGRKVADVDQAGFMTTFAYDAIGQLTNITNALGGVTTYTYDERGNQLTQTDANGHTTHWIYDKLGRVMSRRLPLGMTEAFTYDEQDNIVTYTDFNGHTTHYTYDVENRLVLTQYADGSLIQTSYTPTGQVAAVTDSRGVTTYNYDLRDRLITLVHPDGTILGSSYYATGNRTAATTPAGTTQYTYDTLGRLHTVADPHGRVTTYTYDQVGNLFRTTFPNETSVHAQYDTQNRLTRLEHRQPDGQVFARYDYTLSPTGHRLRMAELNGQTFDYNYDALARLVREIVTAPFLGQLITTYAYDAVGNRLTKTVNGVTTGYTYDANDRLLQEGNTVYTYDRNGNTIQKIEPTGTTSYTYDMENRLITAGTPLSLTHNTYDASGVRVRTVRNGVGSNYIVDTQREVSQIVEERSDMGALVAFYVYGHTLLSQDREDEIAYYHSDALGSTRLLTDSEAQVTHRYTYEAFGNLLETTGTSENPYRFAGEYYEPALDAYYLRARYYHPGSGRFLTRDAFLGNVTEPQTLHPYLYAQANPVTFTDPSGYFSIQSLLDGQKVRAELEQAPRPNPLWFILKAAAAALIVSATVLALKGDTIAPSVEFDANPADQLAVEEDSVDPFLELRRSHRRFPIFISGYDIPHTTAHTAHALYWGKPAFLHRRLGGYGSQWRSRRPECNRRIRDQFPPDSVQCDEYPFASTWEGGPNNYWPGVTLKFVPITEKAQGEKLGDMYTACPVIPNIMRPTPADPVGLFRVIVSWRMPTGYLCRSR